MRDYIIDRIDLHIGLKEVIPISKHFGCFKACKTKARYRKSYTLDSIKVLGEHGQRPSIELE